MYRFILMNRYIILFIVLIGLISSRVKADIFILNGETIGFFNTNDLLKNYPNVEAIRPKLEFLKGTCFDCFCNSYSSEWTDINGELYLTNIYKCEDEKDIKADINAVFNVKDGKVRATWVTDTLWLPKKGTLVTINDRVPIYSTETMVVVVKGKITTIKDISYPVQKNSVFHKGEVDMGYIYRHFNWNVIPDMHDQIKKILVSVESGASGTPERVMILRGPDDSLMRAEAMRVLTQMPWVIAYYHGKVRHLGYVVVINLSEENRKKYGGVGVKDQRE